MFFCSARKAKVDEIKEKLEKLMQSASLVEQRTLYDRAVFWAAVKVQQDKRDSVNQVLTVRAALWAASRLRGAAHARVAGLVSACRFRQPVSCWQQEEGWATVLGAEPGADGK
jgi:hypothetical protein